MPTPSLEYLSKSRRISVLRQELTQPEGASYRLIPLTQGQVAFVDVADFELINQWNWQAQWDEKTQSYYAVRCVRVGDETIHLMMHRLILGLEIGDPRVPDHIESGKTLDNRRSNLRIATSLENSRNRRINRNHPTGYKGVTRQGKKWKSRIRVNGKLKVLGYFSTPEDAHKAYCEAAALHFGQFFNSGMYHPSKFACWCGDSNCTEHP